MVFREGLKLTALGLGLGLAGALAATRLLGGLLIDVRPNDARVLAAVVAVLAGAALLATWLPARRAASLDPAESLRTE